MNSYEDPVNDTYDATAEMYNNVVNYMLENIAANKDKDLINIVVATHNEAGALHAVSKLQELGIPGDNGPVVFGQVRIHTHVFYYCVPRSY